MTVIYYDLGGFTYLMGMDMHFARFDPDDSARCIFEESKETAIPQGPENHIEKYNKIKYRQWRNNIMRYVGLDEGAREDGGRADFPPHVLRVKTAINDTQLPGFRFDFKHREISFEWFGMFDLLFQEDEAVENRITEATKRLKVSSLRSIYNAMLSSATKATKR